MTDATPTFRQRLRERQPLVGTFFKTPSHQLVEVLAGAGLDFIVIDAEHAPFDRAALDPCLLAARAAGLPALVRVAGVDGPEIQGALDLGATGIVAPHARNAATVRRIGAAVRYRGGVRGFSNSPRAGGYGATGMAEHIACSDRDSVAVCQIEDREAVEAIEAIAGMDEADCLFIGRADLAVSYGVDDVGDPAVKEAVRTVCAAARSRGKAVGIHIGHMREAQAYLDMGVSLFVVGSDQSLLRAAAAGLRFPASA
ncbi:HpcH/HpaI aldolase/citrate lyase family protein [Massilia norwichensis]|jgi:2-keto-3-deoxy-L-rhamnonate aldolase RhmA|uniref:Aldolase/citrate lyase family protein n=1 Tax=Massilia norwichensis TaxID=1442366 RepID=A0ABT2A7R2_9BURK|nr:aldolase/citrate lyase family protein [Massilia norwichensis]MCS0590142.1 aldolase/citrate lyase family protein [Massilia norwichensis]